MANKVAIIETKATQLAKIPNTVLEIENKKIPDSDLDIRNHQLLNHDFVLSWSHYQNDALVELTLSQDANIYAQQYALCLPDKVLLQQKLREWIEEFRKEDEV